MADDSEQIDILGDFDFKLEAESDIYDANELPSKSANLLPEYTNPPWMLEQGWTLDSCMDEKSKATIEKMLMEEQYYINGKSAPRKQPRRDAVDKGKLQTSPKDRLKLAATANKSASQSSDRLASKRTWSEQERTLFMKGLEVHGRSWTKISELIPTRTSMQIKNFAHQYFKSQAKKREEKLVTSTVAMTTEQPASSNPIEDVISRVSTAQPTVTVREVTLAPRSLLRPAGNWSHSEGREKLGSRKMMIDTGQVGTIPVPSLQVPSVSVTSLQVDSNAVMSVQITKGPKTSVQESYVPVKSVEEIEGTDILGSNTYSVSIAKPPLAVSHSSAPGNLVPHLDEKVVLAAGLIENLDRFCAVENIIDGDPDDSTEEEIDVDIENDDDDDDEENPILKSRSTSPNSVYEKLLKEANLKLEKEKRLEAQKESVAMLNGVKKIESQEYLNDVSVHVEEKLEPVTAVKPEVGIISSEVASSVQLADEISGSTKDQKLLDAHIVNGYTDTECASGKSEDKEEGDDNCLEESETDSASDDLDRERKVALLPVRKYCLNAVVTCDGEVVELPIPTSERFLEPDCISEEEKRIHQEFFDSRPSSKTPERYLKIRNYIMDSWKKCKPSYLNKTSVRPGLKNCGDVNCIGRIHAYLECTGVINFGCEQSCYNNPGRLMAPGLKEKPAKEMGTELNVAKLEAMRPRKRRIRDALGYWIDEKELEGKTIEHDQEVKIRAAELKSQTAKVPKSVYDPFKLVPCQAFTEDSPPPFSVIMHNSALMVMDMHAHISKTEVIGMLGGEFCQDQGKLSIVMATPCNSISTGMQCEMDPVSQTRASEEINDCGLTVVGWYHSHPTFAPNPSIRDIETQLKFQEWFALGGSNFVGVIVSPFNHLNPGLGSEVRCLTVSQEVNPLLQCNIPYSFEYSSKDCDISELSHIAETARSLASRYSSYRNRVELSSFFSSSRKITCLEKMLVSLKQYYSDEDQCGIFDSIQSAFTPAPVSPDSAQTQQADQADQ